jgi:hypothetical protein
LTANGSLQSNGSANAKNVYLTENAQKSSAWRLGVGHRRAKIMNTAQNCPYTPADALGLRSLLRNGHFPETLAKDI